MSELTTGEILSIIVATAGAAASLWFIFQFIKSKGTKKRLGEVPFVLMGIGICAMGFYFYDVEHKLRTKGFLVKGVTIGYCDYSKRVKGIEFEYYVDGVRYTDCANYEKQVLVPGGKYAVVVSADHPDIGRIDYNRALE